MDCKDNGHCWTPAWENGKYGLRCVNCGEFMEA